MLEKNIFVHIWPLAQTSTPSLVCLRILFFPSPPGAEFLQIGVQVFESFQQKSPLIDADVSVSGVPGVQQEQGVDVSTVFQGSDQSRVIM